MKATADHPLVSAAEVPSLGPSSEHRAPAGWAAEAVWLAAAIGFSLLFGWRIMAPAFEPGFVVQGDARQHVFWMARFDDPTLFPGDLIADYYQAVAPPGVAALYWIASRLVDPWTFSKLLPLALGVIAACCTFGFTRRLHPGPIAPFLATLLAGWYVWQYDDLPSGTARAFMLPLVAGLLWALAADSIPAAAGLVVLAALVYPFGAAIGLALLGLGLVERRGWRPWPRRDRRAWLIFAAATLAVAILLLPSRLADQRYGPVVSLAEARSMPDFGPSGRVPYFGDDFYRYWIASGASGLDLRVTDVLLSDVPIFYPYLALAGLLPLMLLLRRGAPSARLLGRPLILLPRLALVSFGLFLAAHPLFLRLYLPSRYVKTTLPLILAVAAGLGLALGLESLAARLAPRHRDGVARVAALALGVGLALYPAPGAGHFHPDERPALTAFLRSQPSDLLVAGVPEETDDVPSFAARSVLVAREYALPFHLGYYGELRRRTLELIEAYYAESPTPIAEFAARRGVGMFLVNREAFDPNRFQRAWNVARGERTFSPAIRAHFERQRRFALLELAERCATFDDGQVAAVPTTCLGPQPGPGGASPRV